MPMMLVRGLGDGSPSSAPGGRTTLGAFDVSALPGDLLAGAKKWMTPSEAVSSITSLTTSEGQTAAMAHPGVLIGVIGIPLVLLSMITGRHHR